MAYFSHVCTTYAVQEGGLQNLSGLCVGARRSFFCRMKYKSTVAPKQAATSHNPRRKKKSNSDKKYMVVHCTGYLKSWAPAKMGLKEQETDCNGYSCNLSCLVAIGRILPDIFHPTAMEPSNYNPSLRKIHFFSRHTVDGKFLFIDQRWSMHIMLQSQRKKCFLFFVGLFRRATVILGFLPQEILGTSIYDYCLYEDIAILSESHNAALQSAEKVTTRVYRFWAKDNSFVRIQSEWKTFKNPWTKEIEFLAAKNCVIL